MAKQKLTRVPYDLGALIMMRKLRRVAIAQLVVAAANLVALILVLFWLGSRRP
jgi:hypothetical protein